VPFQAPGGLGVFIELKSKPARPLTCSGIGCTTSSSSSEDDGSSGRSGSPFGGDGVGDSKRNPLNERREWVASACGEWGVTGSGGDGGGDASCKTTGAVAFWRRASSLEADGLTGVGGSSSSSLRIVGEFSGGECSPSLAESIASLYQQPGQHGIAKEKRKKF
jgi:hypothetical protein